MGKFFAAMTEYTFLTLRFSSQSIVGLHLCSLYNSTLRLGAIYVLMRVVATAYNHGSF